MGIILSGFFILVGLFVFVLTASGASNEASLWLLGIGFIFAGCIWPIIQFNDARKSKEAELKRVEAIKQKENEWGDKICQLLIRRHLAIDMTPEMVKLGWGSPSQIDEKEQTKSGVKERWVYGQPRRGANYVWFSNGKVVKTKT